MVMPGQVFDSWTACLRSFAAVTRISAALLRSASDIMTGYPRKLVVMPALVAGIPIMQAQHQENEMAGTSQKAKPRGYWQAARSTTVSTGHSALAERWPCPCSHSDALHFSAVRTSSGWPSEKPLPLQALTAALAQSAAPLPASAHGS